MTYTEKELDQFLHGISLSLLSKKSAQHWRYDEETAKEIEWLEALERKVRADEADRKTENSSEKPNNSTISKMEQVEWTKEDCKGCKYNEYPYDSGTCFVRVCINGNKYEPKDEPQTKRPIQCSECRAWHRCFKEKPSYNMIKSRCPIDESHTERSSE